MCKCDPSNRTPFCGRTGCEKPPQTTEKIRFKSSRKLKTCPLCGSKAMLTIHSPKIANASCGVKDDESDSCGLVLFGGTEKTVIEKWNKRHSG